MEGACPKREAATNRLQSLLTDYKVDWWITKVTFRLQSLDLHYKVRGVRFFKVQKSKVSAFGDYKGLYGVHFFTTKVSSVHFLSLQKCEVSAFLNYKGL